MTTTPLRADARRNRDAIVQAARQVFETEGMLAPIDTIATRAGVGNATLYRNFPTREDLQVTVMTDSVTELVKRSEELQLSSSPDAGLREWLYRLAWQLRTWHDLPTVLAAAMGAQESPLHPVCTQLTAHTGALLHRSQAEGSASPGLAVADVFELALAASWAVDRFGDDPARARHRVDLTTAGLFRSV